MLLSCSIILLSSIHLLSSTPGQAANVPFVQNNVDSFGRNVRQPYLTALVTSLESRFPQMPLLDALRAFSPATISDLDEDDVGAHGNEELGRIVAVLGQEHVLEPVLEDGEAEIVQPIIDSEAVIEEWRHLKSCIRTVPCLQACATIQNLVSVLCQRQNELRHHDKPNIRLILRWALAIPITTAGSERDFSRMKLIKSALRSSLKDSTLNWLMAVSLDGPPIATFPFMESLQLWHGKQRRRLPKGSMSRPARAIVPQQQDAAAIPDAQAVAVDDGSGGGDDDEVDD
eukprot:scpid87328/ scgid34510/ 